jgi:hypothetical protein
MAVTLATLDHIGIVKDLIARGPRRQVNIGDEDLPALIEEKGVYLALDGTRAVGLLAVQREPRPPSRNPRRRAPTYAPWRLGMAYRPPSNWNA